MIASMGPRHAGRGIASVRVNGWDAASWLQWVHGTRAVVSVNALASLPWGRGASMGPRHAGRGIATRLAPPSLKRRELQWVHGTRAVVSERSEGLEAINEFRFNGSTARGPWY